MSVAKGGPGTAVGPVVRERLPNGLAVVVREDPGAPVVALTLLVGVGARHESARTNGVTTLVGRVLLKGTRARSALELAQIAEDAGGALESATDQEYAELRARGLARHWPTLLALLHEVATAPRFAPDEVERERGLLLAQIRGLEDQPFQVANRLLSRALYGEHPFGLPTAGTLATVGRLDGADLVRHFERFFTPDRMVLAVSGQVETGEVLRQAGRLFGSMDGRATGIPLVPPPTRPAEARLAEVRPTQQTHVLVGFFAPPIAAADYAPLKVLNAVLGSGMSSRLFRVLRDEHGLAYAVGSFYPTRREGSRLVIHVGTAPGNATRAERGILQEVDRLREAMVPADELERARTFLGGVLDLDLRTNARQSFYRGFFELMGVGPDYVERYHQLIEAVTSDDVRRVARRYLSEPAAAVVGPA
jgi:predicted Zn-dependent peptidase